MLKPFIQVTDFYPNVQASLKNVLQLILNLLVPAPKRFA